MSTPTRTRIRIRIRSTRSTRSTRRRAGRLRPGDDTGSTLLVAVMVASVCMLLSTVVITQSVSTFRDSGEDRQRTSQVHAAEAGIDDVYYRLQSGEVPCAAVPLDVQGSPDATTAQTTITYYDSNGAAFDPCTSSASPARALIRSVATSSNNVGGGGTGRRTMESQVLLSPSSGGEGYAIFTYNYFSVPNSFALSDDGVHTADVYARGGYGCTNSATSTGSVFVSAGGAQLANTCTIAGSLQARDSITMANQARVGADAYSSRGGLTMSGPSRVGRNVEVYGFTNGTAGRVAGTVTARNNTGAYLTDPIEQPMVYVGYEPAKWQAAGFTIDSSAGTTNCNTIKSRMLTVTTPTVFYGNCAMNYSGNNRGLQLKTDVALFLTGGLNIANNFGLASDNAAQTRDLWVIVPAGNGPEPAGWSGASCSGNGINAGNLTDFDRTVHVFMYTCGSISMANSTTFYGQLYGKQVTVANSFSMSFVSLPPAGIDLGGQPATPGFDVEVVYKRETQSS